MTRLGFAGLLTVSLVPSLWGQSNIYPASGKVIFGTSYGAPSNYNFDAVAFEVRTAANPTSTSGIRYTARFSNAGGSGSGVIIQAGYKHSSAMPIEVLRLAPFDGPAEFIFFNDGRSSGLSDARLKTDIHPIDNALSRLASVRGVQFKWKGGSSDQIGLLAQEVEAVFPELVTEVEGRKGVDYLRFSAVLLQGLKELAGRVEGLERDNRALRGRLQKTP